MPRWPDTETYVKALRELEEKITPLQRRMLIANYDAYEHTATTRELASISGASSWHVVNSQYGRLGRLFREVMNYWEEGQQSNSLAILWAPNTRGNSKWLWELIPELARALEQLEWVDPSESRYTGVQEDLHSLDESDSEGWEEEFHSPDEVFSEEELLEGAAKTILVNAYERNPKARRECIKHFGAVCQICKFDFGKRYGPAGEGFIHVHHLVPLASRGEEYVIKPIEHLLPVCPNCHAMLHLGGECRTPKEVEEMLRD